VSAFVSEHHRELVAQGQQSLVFTFGHTEVPAIPDVYRTPGLPMGNSPFRMNLSLDRKASQAARSLDVFHIHEPFVIANVAIGVARQIKRPLVFTNHTRHDTYVHNFPVVLQPLLNRHVAATVARAIRVSAITTSPSEDSVQWMRSLVPDVPERVRVMRNGIHLAPFEQVSNPHTRDEFGIPADAMILMYVGRVTPEKNLSVLAAGILQAIALGVNIHWMIVGDGRTRAELERQIAPAHERVHFLGKHQRDQIAPYVAMTDVFVTASQSETNPLSVIEAMACGKPYIALKALWWDGFTKIPQVGSAGLLTEHDPQALANAIQQLADNPTLRAEMGAAARQLSHHFDIRNVTEQWIALYAEAIERMNMARTPTA